MRMTIPIPLPNKANTYEVHFNKTFWSSIQEIVFSLKKYIKGPLYWIGPSREVKKAEEVIGYYSKRILENDTDGPVCVDIWIRGRLDVDSVKAVLDGIELGGRIKNDRQVEQLHVYRLPGKNESFDLSIHVIDQDAV
jgi:Holliday junction resolvase RusA-like endonuclease